MKAVLQRVSSAQVEVDGEIVGSIEKGLLILFGAVVDDDPDHTRYLAKKTAELRIFQDDNNKMNLSLLDIGGSALVVSQFTLAADCRKGRRPSFNKAAKPEVAIPLYEQYCQDLRNLGIPVQTGQFGAMMNVSLLNQGPVTIILDTEELLPKK